MKDKLFRTNAWTGKSRKGTCTFSFTSSSNGGQLYNSSRFLSQDES
jgi:hypothetical protein